MRYGWRTSLLIQRGEVICWLAENCFLYSVRYVWGGERVGRGGAPLCQDMDESHARMSTENISNEYTNIHIYLPDASNIDAVVTVTRTVRQEYSKGW
jgi:hypothetical protein